MNRQGANIPSAWLIIIPLVNIWWLWKYCEGVEQVTNKKVSGVLSFVLLWLLGLIGMAIIQHEFNQVGEAAVAAPSPAAPIETPQAGSSTESDSNTAATSQSNDDQLNAEEPKPGDTATTQNPPQV